MFFYSIIFLLLVGNSGVNLSFAFVNDNATKNIECFDTRLIDDVLATFDYELFETFVDKSVNNGGGEVAFLKMFKFVNYCNDSQLTTENRMKWKHLMDNNHFYIQYYIYNKIITLLKETKPNKVELIHLKFFRKIAQLFDLSLPIAEELSVEHPDVKLYLNQILIFSKRFATKFLSGIKDNPLCCSVTVGIPDNIETKVNTRCYVMANNVYHQFKYNFNHMFESDNKYIGNAQAYSVGCMNPSNFYKFKDWDKPTRDFNINIFCQDNDFSTSRCCQDSKCNWPKNINPNAIILKSVKEPKVSLPFMWILVLTALVILVAICLIVIMSWLMKFKFVPRIKLYLLENVAGKKLLSASQDGQGPLMGIPGCVTGASCGDSFPSTFNSCDNDDSHSSSKGYPLLIERTVSRQIILCEKIGAGRYGEVYRGSFRGDDVAVKIISSRAESSWKRESKIYLANCIRHQNILGFIAIDNKDAGYHFQLWLVTEFHPLGSLDSFLMTRAVTLNEAIHMVAGIASGLSHLHTEMFGARYKPSIAHRDLKSKNILVKNDLTCCIGDFGLSLAYDDDFNAEVQALCTSTNNESPKFGTKRYLSPEYLDESVNFYQFDSYKRGDMYALGLVIWEICRCTSVPEVGILGLPYEVPYQQETSFDPSLDEMRDLICPPANVRPRMVPDWSHSPAMAKFQDIMNECWYVNPASRLNAVRVRKEMNEVRQLADLVVDHSTTII